MRNRTSYRTTLAVLSDIYKDIDYPYTTNGNSVVIRLDDNRRVKVDLVTTWNASEYDAIRFCLVSKTCGEIDRSIVKFKDVFPSPTEIGHPNKISKHIWIIDGHLEWYGRPDPIDYETLNTQLDEYISTWE